MFLQYLKAKGRNLLELVCREDVCAFIEQEQDRGLKPASVSCRVDALYAFIRFWVDREVFSPDLLKRKLRVKGPERLPRAIDPEDVRGLLSVIRHLRDRAMALVLFQTGMRIGELLNTTLADVNLAEKRIEIFETQKNRVGWVVYLAEDACQALEHWLKVRPRKTELIFSGQGGRPLSYEVARSRFVRLLDKAELGDKGYTLPHHRLTMVGRWTVGRKTFAPMIKLQWVICGEKSGKIVSQGLHGLNKIIHRLVHSVTVRSAL